MYEAHFGLDRRPFGETALASAYVPLPSRDAAVRRLRYGLERGLGPVLLHGRSGTGKTIAAHRLAADIGAPTVHLTFPVLPAAELVAHLAEEFGGTPVGATSIASALRRLREALGELSSRGLRPLLIVDEAQLIQDASTFESLRLLLNFQSGEAPDLGLILVGTAEVVLRIPEALQDRLAACSQLLPLTRTESASYIQGRLAAAGAPSPLFEPQALADIHQAALGIPRRLNLMADLCLLIAYAEGAAAVGPRIVGLAAREFSAEPLAA